MEHSKAEFKALREQTGFTHQDIARIMDVRQRSVERWESPAYPTYYAPQDAWDILEDALRLQQSGVESALEVVEEWHERACKEPREVTLIYWQSEEDYREHHYPADGGSWRQANANSRATYAALTALGYQVRFVPSSDKGKYSIEPEIDA